MNYLLLTFTILLATGNSVILHKRQGNDKNWNGFLFNAVCSAVWIILLTVINGGLPRFTQATVFFGVLYGLVQTSFLFFKMKALDSGPIGITTLVGNCSLVVSAIVGTVLWKESITFTQIAGVVLLMTAIFLCNEKTDGGVYTSKWKFYVVGFFLSAAMVGLVFKAFSTVDTINSAGDMMIIAALVMIILNFVIMMKRGMNIKSDLKCRRELLYALLCGVISCLYNRVNIYLSGALPSIVFFPVFNGSIIILSVISGLFIFKEKLHPKQIIGFLIGAISIILMGIK